LYGVWNNELPKNVAPRERAPVREEVGGLYTRVLVKSANSEQMIQMGATQEHAAGGVVTIFGKMELFWALCMSGVKGV
jgi:hypothetical protein